MRKLTIGASIIVNIILSISCDTTEDFLLKVNSTPTINFTFLDREVRYLEDSVKITTQLSYPQSFTVTDNNLAGVFFQVIGGQGQVVSIATLTDSELRLKDPVSGIYDFAYKPLGLGTHEIVVRAKDKFNETDSLILKLTAFQNIPPVAFLEIKPNRVVSKYEYTIDASQSYDRDEKFGGRVAYYEFRINSQLIELREPSFRFIFGGEDIVAISVRVKDNDGEWSEKYEELFLID